MRSKVQRAGIVIPTPELAEYGIHGLPMDLYSIAPQLQAHDPDLYLAWIPELERVAICRWITKLNSPEIITVCQNEDGSFRVPDDRDVQEIKYGDMWNNKDLTYENYDKARQKKQATAIRNFNDIAQEMVKDIAHMAALSGVVSRNMFPMAVTKKEKRG